MKSSEKKELIMAIEELEKERGINKEYLLESLLKGFESSQEELFDSQIFGKKLGDVVSTNLVTKLNALPESTRLKVQQLVKTLANKSKQNLIAIVF
mgnify:CR=1 FL=1